MILRDTSLLARLTNSADPQCAASRSAIHYRQIKQDGDFTKSHRLPSNGWGNWRPWRRTRSRC